MNKHPRCSGEEKEVSDFLMNFAKARDLEAYQDEVYNVIIKKPGTEGYEDSETMILQGHMDMVCVKGEGSDHDFSKDPIEMIVDGDYLKANDTTLGADDGIAVAYMLAVLDSDDLSHPPLEILVTTSEETGMDGVQYMSKDIEGLVQTSLNNAIVEEEDGKVKITTSVRSSSSSSLREILSILEVVAERTGAEIEETGNYPAWQFEEDSPVRDRALKVYKDLFGEEAEVSAIHAGLECGLLKEILPETDMLSFGPNLYDVHTEKEHISIPSARRVWEFLVALLEESK